MTVTTHGTALTRLAFQPDMPFEIMGRAEIAEALGVSNSNVVNLKGLPEPVCVLKATSVWLASDIRAFARERAAKL